MKRVRTSALIPGMITAEDVYSFNNQLVVGKGTALTDELITRLEYYSVLSIHVDEDGDSSNSQSGSSGDFISRETARAATVLEPQFTFNDDSKGFAETSEELSYSERVRASEQFKEFRLAFVNKSVELNNKLHAIVNGEVFDRNELLSSVSGLLSNEITTIGMFDMLHNLRNFDDLTYVHSMNVGLMANIMGHWLHYSDEDVEVLTLAGLLHDIGKIAVPNDLIKKPGKLTDIEYGKVKAHTVEGYKVLKNIDVDERVKNAALLHHERADGSGYPLKYTDDQIPDFAKIIAIVDVYDAMTAARVYRGPQCPFKVIAIFEEEGLKKYDSRYLLTFLDNIGQTYMNNRVKLNDGRKGDIVLMRKTKISRPLIKLTTGDFVDLLDHPELYIDDLV